MSRSPAEETRREPQFGRTLTWVSDACLAEKQIYAAALYGHLTAHYGFADRTVLLTYEELARVLGVTVRTIGRCLKFLRDIDAIRTKQHNDAETGNCAGFVLTLAGIHY